MIPSTGRPSATKMSDLPVELWLHILSFLPRHYKRRAMGTNRTLYEIAMNDIYREVRLISEHDRPVFSQLRLPSISQRVRHVYIRPAFFPSVKEADSQSESTYSSRRLRSMIPIIPRSTPDDILKTAGSALACCPAVQEVTIILHDLSPLPSFTPFLKTLWGSVGSRLQKLTVNVTHAKLPIILNPAAARELKSLTALEIHLAPSRFRVPLNALVADTLLPFTTALRGTLVSLTIVPSSLADLADYFKGLGYFPHLRKLNPGTSIPWNEGGVVESSSLTAFLAAHQDILDELSVKWESTGPRQPPFGPRARDAFPKFRFSALRTLNVCASFDPDSFPSILPAQALHATMDLSYLTRLESLSIPDVPLMYEAVESLVSILAQSQLRRLQLSVDVISPQLMDTLATKAPGLQELDLTYLSYGSHVIVSLSEVYSRFAKQMESRRYPHWKIGYLRLAAHSAYCGEAHYDRPCMKLIAECLPTKPIFGMDQACFCS
ncbi:hypothetical protein FPV67DRAFT_1672353 [Lyophyllum atratum]|nr:hypothetical protein FPV67DRAFT_1672353 [Lyophyllum atratum]